MQSLQIIKPVLGINTDVASKYLSGNQTRYALNLERTINNQNGGMGYNSGVNTPCHANQLQDYPQPAGVNIPIGKYASKRTNELYVWVYNDLGNHHIYRINKNNTIDIILMDPKLNFSADPKFGVHFHAHLFYNHNSFTEQGNKLIRKYLCWVAGNEWQGFLDVETSLATNGFRVPYFDTADRTQLWQLAPRPSLKCPYGDYDPTVDLTKSNLVQDKTWQFRIMFVYTDARPTAWSPISTMFLADTTVCRATADGQPRCINLRLDAGGPHVEKIILAYRNCVGSISNEQDPEWFESVVINKYKQCLDETDTGSTLAINQQKNIRPDAWIFTLKGVPATGDRVNVNFSGNNGGAPQNFAVVSEVMPGWTLTDLLNDLNIKLSTVYPNVFGYTDTDGFQGYQISGFFHVSGNATITKAVQGTAFWERTIRDDFDYDAITNTFLHKFCADGTCLPIDRRETNRNYNDIPKQSYALIPLENKLGLLNNVWGDDPIDCEEVKKITFEPVERTDNACMPKYCKVKVAIIMHNAAGFSQPIWVKEENINTPNDLGGLTKYYGGIAGNISSGEIYQPTYVQDHKQVMADTSADAGFLVYVEGSEAAAKTKQYKQVFGGGRSTDPVIVDGIKIDTVGEKFQCPTASQLWQGIFFIHIAEITVIQGTSGFIRVADPRLSPTDGGIRQSSAPILGVFNNLAAYHPVMGLGFTIDQANTDFLKRELWFDSSAVTEVDLTHTPFILHDHTFAATATILWNVLSMVGYLHDSAGRPVPGAFIQPFANGPNDAVNSFITDHNGFYFAQFVSDGNDRRVGMDFYIESDDCESVNGGNVGFDYSPATHHNHQHDQDAGVTTAGYEDNMQVVVRVLLKDSDSNPLAGIYIAIEGVQAQMTGSDGYANFILRKVMAYYDYPTDTYTPPLKVVVMQSGICYLTGADCSSTMPWTVMLPCNFGLPDNCLPDCYYSATPPHRIDIETFTLSGLTAPVLRSGYHPGGIYPMAIKLIDAAGRETAAEKVENDTSPIILPSVQEMQAFNFTDIKFKLNGFKAPAGYVKLAILIAANRAFDDFVEWIADKVEFVDSSGTTATGTAATKIKISIRSLYDNANLYAFGTNVRYQWVQGDKIEIVCRPDGSIYPDVMQFNIEADYNNLDATLDAGEERFNQLIISYNAALFDLAVGAKIKLIRKNQCLKAELFYECCQLIDLVDGVPAITEGIVSGWDTYMVRRGIRYDDLTHTFPFPFLHHSPSDFCCDHCISRGRISATNTYAKKLQFGRNIRISNSFLENGNYNGLGSFDELQTKTFSGEQRGDIVAAISMEQIFMLIFEHDNGMINSATEFVRVNQQGQIVALPPDAIVSDTQSKIVGNYGCQYEDVDSIVYGDGWVFWVDIYNKLPVIHNWNEAADASVHPSDGGQTQGYWKRKLQAMGNKHIVSGYDIMSGNVLVTFFAPGDLNAYVHSNREYIWDANETIAFCVQDRRWPTTYSFTPEYYACFPDNDKGDIFITFKGAKPYLHRVLGNTSFNTFFGVPVDQIFEFIINEVPEKVKVYLTMQQQSGVAFWSDRIISSLGHQSILPPAMVKKLTEGKYDCHFLCPTNRNGGLYNGKHMRGNWLQVRMIRDNSVNNIYNTVDPIKQSIYSELDRIIARFSFSEQSAYNTNNNP